MFPLIVRRKVKKKCLVYLKKGKNFIGVVNVDTLLFCKSDIYIFVCYIWSREREKAISSIHKKNYKPII